MFAPIQDDTASPTQRQLDEHDSAQRRQRARGLAEWLLAHGVSLPDSGDAPRESWRCPRCGSETPGVTCIVCEECAASKPASAPDGLLPDTFIERAVQAALAQAERYVSKNAHPPMNAWPLSGPEARAVRDALNRVGSAPRGTPQEGK